MRKVAVFGNAGAGKSTLARGLSDLTGIPLYPVDMMQYQVGGVRVSHDQYLKLHSEVLQRDTWIIDGFGCRPSAWERFAAADTLVYIDLPLIRHLAWVTKRLFKGMFRTPEGWPEGSPMISSTMSSYRVLWLCHRKLTPKYREFVAEARDQKHVYHLKSVRELDAFPAAVSAQLKREQGAVQPAVAADRPSPGR